MSHNRNDPDKHSSYMDGIPVKISELYKPPKKITLPVGIANRQLIENLEGYDFRLERSTAEKMAKLRELRKTNIEKRRQRIAAEDKKLEELKKANASETTTIPTTKSKATADDNSTAVQSPESICTQETESGSNSTRATYTSSCATEHNMLTPVPVNQPMAHQQVITNFDPIKSGINISDFESDSSPFDNMELKTLNDIAELASVLQPGNDVNSRAQQTYQSYSSTDNNQSVNQSLYNQSVGYGIKPSRPFIQQGSVIQPHNLLASNGYNNGRINGVYNNVYRSSVSDSFWNHQPTVSYSNARTTPGGPYGVGTSEYGTGSTGYPSRNSEYTHEVGATGVASGPNLAGNTGYLSRNSEYTHEVGSSRVASQPNLAGNTGYSAPNSDFTTLNSEFMGKNSEYTNKIGNTSEYAPKFRDYTSKMGVNSDYTPGTSTYRSRVSDFSMPKANDMPSDYTTTNTGGSASDYRPKMEYASGFSWTNFNYQPQRLSYDNTNSIYVPNVRQPKVDPNLQQGSDTSVESRLSVNSGVTDLIRELKLELDDKRENDSRKIVENERINTSVENDKLLKQKMVASPSPSPTPLLANPINQLTPSCRNLVHRIAEMGFAEARVARAVQRLGDNETKVLEFLLQVQRLEEESGCAGERVEVALAANRYDTVESARYLEILQQLLDLGFVETKVTEALALHANDRDKAIESLIS